MAARIMLAKTAKPSLPLHLLRGPLSAASAPLNLNLQQPNSPVGLQQIPPRADESPRGLSSLLQQLRSADLELRRKSVPAKDDDDDLDDEDGSDGCLDGCYLPEFFSRRDDDDYDYDDDDDDDDDEKGKGKNGRRRK